MAIKLVFEDGENTPSSLLLKKSQYGKYIYFSNGVHQLLNKAMSIKDADDTIYMFYDVSPNNVHTVKGYKALVDTLKQNKVLYKNMYVVPIICIEYHICKVFDKYKWFYTVDAKALEMIDKLVRTFDWSSISDSIKNDVYLGASLEHVYKNILVLSKMKCLHNSFAYDKTTGTRKINSREGLFYERDCLCERKFCKINCIDTLEYKAEKLYTSLPAFIIIAEEHKQLLQNIGISIINLSNAQIKEERKNFYKQICANMKLPMINIYL